MDQVQRVAVYSKKGCPFCSLMKAELIRRRITFTEIDLSDDNVRASFYTNTGTNTVPQLFILEGESSLTDPVGERFGGWSDMANRWKDLTSFVT